MLSTFSYFSTSCKHTRWVYSLFYCHFYLFFITQCNNAVHLLYLVRFIKMNSFPCQLSRWSLNFLKTRLTSAEIRCLNCQKSDIRTNSPLLLCFTFEQIFVFCRLINKNMLEWFLLIIYHALNRSTNFLVETIPHCVFN